MIEWAIAARFSKPGTDETTDRGAVMFVDAAQRAAARVAYTALIVALLAVGGAAHAAERGSVTHPGAVMELFTSQACSSCPAADAVLADHADRSDVLALAWHVDYWDYLGWRDTFGDPRHSLRQRRYAKALGEGVYTPQLIVNGVLQGVGHRAADVERMLRLAGGAAVAGAEPFVPLAVKRAVRGYHVSLAGRPAERAEDATLFLVWFDPRREVTIAGGENDGRRMVYRNVVRGMQMLGSVLDGRLEVSPSDAALRPAGPQGRSRAALVLQRTEGGLPGAILGAAVLGDVPAR